ncbi:hypothetical protein BH11PLA2_BH11PLA2_11860 [soil metagenome]
MRRVISIQGGGVAILAALALAHLTGCGNSSAEGYEPTAIYPPRTDPLITSLATVPPPKGLHPPGMLNESIASLTAQGAKMVNPSNLSADQQQTISKVLVPLFGTPADPIVADAGAAALGLTPERLAAGSIVYKRHCVQCHGMSGDGRGPTSLWVYPPARDFREAGFKFVSTPSGQGWPTKDDIVRSVRRGIGGNSMPSFALLSDKDLDDVATYTLHLMFRGKVEFDLINRMLSQEDLTDVAGFARQRLTVNFNEWQRAVADAKDPAILPPTDPAPGANIEAIRRGHATFISEKAACTTCHVDYGRRSVWRYDLWGVAVKPAALTEGQHRGGSEALDLYRRLKCGVPGVGMPPAPTQYTDNDLWDVVAFLRALPDPKFLPDDVRKEVYPNVR